MISVSLSALIGVLFAITCHQSFENGADYYLQNASLTWKSLEKARFVYAIDFVSIQ